MGLVWLCHDGEISTSVMFAIVKGHGEEGSAMSIILGCIAQVLLLAAKHTHLSRTPQDSAHHRYLLPPVSHNNSI